MSAIKTTFLYLASVLTCVPVLFFSFIFFAAWSDGNNVCPDGNQCSDATRMFWIAGGVDLICIFLFGLCVWAVVERHRQKNQ